MSFSGRIKYAKLRLFKPSSSLDTGGKSQSKRGNEGNDPKTPSSESVNRMEQEVINLSDNDDCQPAEPDEPIIKRTRLNGMEKSEKPKLPKFPNKPPADGEGVISKFFKPSDDDFEPPKPSTPPKPKTKAQRKTTATRKPRAPRKPKNQSDIRKVFQKYKDNDEELLKNLMLEHTLADRLDPDQFQLALAMSRSLVDQGSSQSEPNISQAPPEEVAQASSSTSSVSSEERRIRGLRTTLEQYGFKCKNSYNDYDLNVIFGSAPKNVKKIKHNRPTMLIRRDPEELVDFMKRQAERLLQDVLCRPLADCSGCDLNARTYGSNIFWMSQHSGKSDENLSDYYVESLVEMSTVKAGYLLKDWGKIPGRERTPERRKEKYDEKEDEASRSNLKCDGEKLDNSVASLDIDTVLGECREKYEDSALVHVGLSHENIVAENRRSASPDLFGSDSGDEVEDSRKSVQEDFIEVKVTLQTEHRDEEEDDNFLTAMQSETELVVEDDVCEEPLEGIVRAASSENIFEDSDPIIGFEVYSSEEAKMCSSLPVENINKKHVDNQVDDKDLVSNKDNVVLLSSTDDSNSNNSFPFTSAVGCNQDQKLLLSPGKGVIPCVLSLKNRQEDTSRTNVGIVELEDDNQMNGMGKTIGEDETMDQTTNNKKTVDDKDNEIETECGEESRFSQNVFSPPDKNAAVLGLPVKRELNDPSNVVVETIELLDDDSDASNSHQGNAPVTNQSTSSTCKTHILDQEWFPSPVKQGSLHGLLLENRLRDVTQNEVQTVELEDDHQISDIGEVIEKVQLMDHTRNSSNTAKGIDHEIEPKVYGKERNFDEIVSPFLEKESSSHKLSMKGESNESSNVAVKSIELLDDDSAEVEKEDHGKDCSSNCDDPEDVFVISDDEVNYSIRRDFSLAYNMSPLSPLYDPTESSPSKLHDDLDGTKIYFDALNFNRPSSDKDASIKSPEADIISSGDDAESPGVSTEPERADNTMAFLDGLIKKFNLPTTFTKQSTCDDSKPCDLDDYMNNYEIPDFPDDPEDHIENRDDVQLDTMENPAPITSEQLDLEVEQILGQANALCSQLERQERPPATPIRRTISDSVLVGPVKRKRNLKSPTVKRKPCFTDKFKELTKDHAPPPVKVEIRLNNVSPRPDYEGMASPLLHRELFKFGLKQATRKRAVQILNNIYDALHPFVEIAVEDECDSDCELKSGDSNCTEVSVPRRRDGNVPEIEGEEYILPSRPRKKTFWCAVPLHIAFHNMISEDPGLRRQLLRYQPIELDAIYSHMKEIGLRYESNDLIAFLDKRCITFRTAQGSGSRTKKTTASQLQTG
ncbi:structure-specific endonuclease subunit SLX4 [Armigeres subalbatus]|uniref:structure-specific endonuclease subunit SLX4 n=1 Tax=Armigeres subalbatus TaxID=124917 RepID=UPI002ED5DAE0